MMADGEGDFALPRSEADEQGDGGAGSGAQSLAGYDYQVDVSIWLALDLMLGLSLTQMVELEPGSEEDLEAELSDDEPGRVVTRVGLDGYTLIVQVKLRSGNAWSVKDINRLLKHGSVARPSAANRLATPTVRYLLVTSAALNGGTRGLKVKRAGTWPKKSEMPASTANVLPSGAHGRVAVIGNLDEERLMLDIRRLLIERFGIPNARWIECLLTLREEARLRIRRVGEGRWRREELAHIIRSHDGYLASSPQLENYVQPRNWHDLIDAMRAPKYAAIIVGQSGTGKTLTTSKLYEELRRGIPGLTRVPIRRGPQQLRDDRTPPPVLYDIEDPWGRYDFDPESRPWNDQLSQWLAKARADCMIVATSRRDVAMSSGGLKSVEPWVVPLEAEHYGKAERQRLYRTRIDTLPRDIRLLATDAEGRVLDELATPLEIEKFFDALRTVGRPERQGEHGFIRDAIARAHEQSIELTVVQQIEQRDDVRSAAVIWAFLKASDRLSVRILRSLEMDLAERYAAFEKGVTPLVDFFVAARNLRSGAGDVTYYHPRVEAGVEAALKRHAVPASVALRALLDVLTDADGPGEEWGAGFAARIVAATKRIPELNVEPRPQPAAKINAWLEERLADASSKFSEHMLLAAAAGSPASNAAEFARYVLHRSDTSFGVHMWERPDRPDAWYDRLRADPTIAAIAGRFVREMLPDDCDHYTPSLVTDLDRLALNLTPAYLEAAADIVRQGFTPSTDVVVAGALRDLDGFEVIVDSAVKVRTPTSEELERARQTHLALINEVYSSDYAEHLAGNDDGYTADEFLRAYADRIRWAKGWRSLAEHRHAAPLLSYWMRSLTGEAKMRTPSADEVSGAFAIAFGCEEEDALWFVLMQHWDEQYRDRLLSRIHEGSTISAVRHAALACLIEQAPETFVPLVDKLRQSGKIERVIEILIDLAHLQDRRDDDGDERETAVNAAIVRLDPAFQELCAAARKGAKDGQVRLSPVGLALLANPAHWSADVRALRIRRHADLPSSVSADIVWTLANSEDDNDCVAAIDAAIALGLTDVIATSLNHRFAHVVAKALGALGDGVSAPLPTSLLALAAAEGSPVRKALVRLLGAKPHADHIPTLLNLAKDQWSSSSRFYGEDDNFPIARSAVDVIAALAPSDRTTLEQLQKIALETSDWLVRTNLFSIIAAEGGCSFQSHLFDLAITPGRIRLRRAAVLALLAKAETLDLAVVRKITVDLLATRAPPIAVILTLIAAIRMPSEERLELARGISAIPKRRALVLLMIWHAVKPQEAFKVEIEKLVPVDHPSLAWLNAGPTEKAEDALIADLGDPPICREVLSLLNPTDAKL